MRTPPTPLLLAALALSASCHTVPDSRRAPTPQRPTLAKDTHMTAAGTWELEAGMTLDPGDDWATPTELKRGVSERSEVFLGFAPLVHVEGRGRDETGFGDVVLGARTRLFDEEGDRPSAAFMGTLKLPTADEDDGLGTGEVDAGVAGILTRTFAGAELTSFCQVDFLGSPRGGIDLGGQIAVQAVQPREEFSVFSELAFVWVPEYDLESLFVTFGGSTDASRSTVFDGGVVVGITEDAPDFQVVFGLTTNFGAFRGRHR